jgi:hypothetical protein
MELVLDPIIARIVRESGVDGLLDLLADRMTPADLQSLLLAVRVRQAGRLTAPMVLHQYERQRFTGIGRSDPGAVAALERDAFALLADAGYTGVELSPVSPLGTVSVLGPVHQNKVVATDRNSEVVADSTNSLALEAALRRRKLLRADPRDPSWVQLSASHRLLRAQKFEPPYLPHFRLLAVVTAGRDQGSHQFETTSLAAQLDALLSVTELAIRARQVLGPARVAVTDLTGGQWRGLWRDSIISPVLQRHPHATVEFDDTRTSGREYYVDACFKLYVSTLDGRETEIGDGGFTTWTRSMLTNAKERLLTGCLSVDRLVSSGGR